jgi:Tfp pilus assembly protein PilX
VIVPTFIVKQQQGFALVTVLLILLVLTLLGIMATNNTTTELRIAGNDKVHKQTFYQADGGTELAERLVFENTICSQVKNGFTHTGLANPLLSRIVVFDQAFADNNPADATVTDTNREFVFFPEGFNAATPDDSPRTNFLTTHTVGLNPGSGLQMVSGYEGLGVGATSGTHRSYTILSQHHGVVNSQTTLATQWRLDNFPITSAAVSDCKY